MRRLNFSSKRLAIYNLICSTDCHPSARWVYDNLKDDRPDLSLGTVYRNISLFKEQGIVKYVATVDGEERIDGRTDPHAHFVCSRCGRIYDVEDNEPTAAETALIGDGFSVESRSVTYYGVCGKCSK